MFLKVAACAALARRMTLEMPGAGKVREMQSGATELVSLLLLGSIRADGEFDRLLLQPIQTSATPSTANQIRLISNAGLSYEICGSK